MESGVDAPGRVKAVIKQIGAEVTNVFESGQVDFDLEGLSGTARERQRLAMRGEEFDGGPIVETSFDIAFDTDEAEAAAFVQAHRGLPIGELLVDWDPYEGTNICLLAEFDPDSGKSDRDAWRAGYLAQMIASAWVSRQGGASDLANTLARAGIAMPPLGRAGEPSKWVPADSVGESPSLARTFDEASVYTYGPWHWGSTYVEPFDLYLFETEQVARRLLEHGPFFAMGHAGHGLASYGLSLVTCMGPVAAFVQHGYGGIVTSLKRLIAINATYSRLHWLFNSEQLEDSTAPLRWLLLYSEFRGPAALVDLDRLRAGEDFDDVLERFKASDAPLRLDESLMFATLADRLGLQDGTVW
jgi:hypothetical protein